MCTAIVWHPGSSSVFRVQPAPALIFIVRTIVDPAGTATVTSYACAAGAVMVKVAVERPRGSRSRGALHQRRATFSEDGPPRALPRPPLPFKMRSRRRRDDE